MRLFGSGDGPHMAHFHCTHSGDQVNAWWEVRNCEGLRWRVLRSGERFAQHADVTADCSQTLVVEGDLTHFSDAVAGLGTCFYTVFSQEDGKGWERQVAVKVNAREHLFWHHPETEAAIMKQTDLGSNPPTTTWGSVVRRRGDEFMPIPLTPHQGGADEWLEAAH
jgi:hypothetical protein